MPEIGKRIRSRREQLGMTQEELASRLGYKSKTTIAKIENGTNDIVQSKVTEFAKVLDTTPAYLMGWTQLDGNVVNEKEPELTARDERDIAKILEQTKELLLSQEGLMFDGDPASPEAINSILDAMQIGMEMAKKQNKEKYTPKKYKQD